MWMRDDTPKTGHANFSRSQNGHQRDAMGSRHYVSHSGNGNVTWDMGIVSGLPGRLSVHAPQGASAHQAQVRHNITPSSP